MNFDTDNNRYKLLVFDLDGTILDKNTKISTRMIKLCSKLRKRNVLITIATGRGVVPALNYAKILGIKIPIICLGGSLTVNPLNKDIIRETKLDKKISINLISKLDPNYYEVGLYYGETLYINELSEWSKGYIERQDIPYIIDPDFSQALKSNPTMILAVSTPKNIDSIENYLKDFVKNSLSIVRSMPHFYEISNSEGNKFHALTSLLQNLKLNFGNVITFGNGKADIEIIKNSGIGISIRNSPTEVLEISDLTVEIPEKQGVENFLEEFFFKGKYV